MSQPHIEIKARDIRPVDVRKIIAKGNVIAVLTTGKISNMARTLLDEAGIEWVDEIPEKEFMESEAQEMECEG